jgi:DNA-binding XRE family transcriptional regulator
MSKTYSTGAIPGKSNLQVVIEKQRVVYENPDIPPLLQQICQMYRITFREFAAIFEISTAHAEAIIKHRKFPALPLAISICRYFECTVEELFGWRVDDDGKRRPLLIVDPKTKQAYRLSERDRGHETMNMIRERMGEKGLRP